MKSRLLTLTHRLSALLRPKQKSNLQQNLDLKVITDLNPRRWPRLQQLKYVGSVLDSDEKKRILVASTIFLLAIVGLGLNFYTRNTTVKPAYGGTYTEGLVGNARFINPLLAPANDVDRDLTALLFSGLIRVDEQGLLVPDMAKSYLVSEDQKTYTFDLREGVLWHDGQPLTASDVEFTINSIQNPDFKSPLRLSFNGVQAEVISETQIRFNLDKPYPNFLDTLTVGILPRHIWYAIPPTSAHLAEAMTKPVGSGPFRFKSLTKDSASGSIRSYSLEANKSFYERRPYINEIIFKFYPDFGTAVEALRNQNVDAISLLPKDDRDRGVGKNIGIHNISLPQYTAIFFNPETNAVLKDKNVRQALSMVVDRQAILNLAISGEGTAIVSPVLPGMIGYQSKDIPGVNQEEAAKLLDKAGWTTSTSTPWRVNKQDQALVIKLTAVNQPEQRATANLLKTAWENIGVQVQEDLVDRSVIRNDYIQPRNYQVLVFGQIVNSGQDHYLFWHSTQNRHPGLNLSVMANRDIDSALEKARAATNEEQRAEFLTQFQNKLQEEVFAVFLYNPTYSYPVSNKVKGLETLTRMNIPAERFANIRNWYIKTARSWSK